MKLAVIQKRGEAKDYLDIVSLLDAGQTLGTLLSAVALRALEFFDDLKGDPLRNAVASVRLDSLPELPPGGTIGAVGLPQ
jgi:hypothetical protein